MASTKELRKTLPRRAPNHERHLQDGMSQKTATYSLVNLNAAQLKELEGTINDEDADTDESSAKVADQPDFSGRTLRDVYDHHILMRDECDWMDPLYFIVADQEDYKGKGLLVVNLCTFDSDDDDDDEGEEDDTGRIGVARCSSDKAAGWVLCFKLAEMLWSELKYAEYKEWGGSNPYEKYDTAVAEGEKSR